MTLLEVLKAARKRISKPEHWTQGTCARDAEGHMTLASSPDAVQWCAFGAILSVDRAHDFTGLEALRSVLPLGYSVQSFNDTPRRKHSEVLDMFDRAVERLQNLTQ